MTDVLTTYEKIKTNSTYGQKRQCGTQEWTRAFQNHGRRIKGSIVAFKGFWYLSGSIYTTQWQIVFPYLIGYTDTARATEYFVGTWHEAFMKYAAHDLVVMEKRDLVRAQLAQQHI